MQVWREPRINKSYKQSYWFEKTGIVHDRSKDLPVMRPKSDLAIFWIVRLLGMFLIGNTLTTDRLRPRLFGIKVQLVKDLGCLEVRGILL